MSTEGNEVPPSVHATNQRRLGKRIVNCPYKVMMDSEIIDEFYDVRDAIAAARTLKMKDPQSHVNVLAEPSGKLILQV